MTRIPPAFSFHFTEHSKLEIARREDLYVVIASFALPWFVIAYGIWQLGRPL